MYVAPGAYMVQFTDKKNTPFSIQKPSEFLSVRALERRNKYNIAIDSSDLPVNPKYVDSLRKLGARVMYSSKWFNTAVFYADPTLATNITSLGFVRKNIQTPAVPQLLKISNKIAKYSENLTTDSITDFYSYGLAETQIKMLNGHILHNLGFHGEGMVISVLDAGFYHANVLRAFDSININHQILGCRDFVAGDSTSYDQHPHGMNVLSVLAGNIKDTLIGVAPKAKYWLLRSENAATENVIEEENWVAAAEFADSVGTDIISTSLGYSLFDDASMNHTYSQMNGRTTHISVGAGIASAKGILVVCSAGNEGEHPWNYVTAPADGIGVLTVGAVDASRQYVGFSSKGPSYDGRVKPNVAAMGYNCAMQSTTNHLMVFESGTSFSCPLMAGMAACLWQANPQLNNQEIINAIQKSASRFSHSDTLTGYGIPDFAFANMFPSTIASDTFFKNLKVVVEPNPFREQLSVKFYLDKYENINVQLFDLLGRKLYTSMLKYNFSSSGVRITNLQYLSRGIYILVVNVRNTQLKFKIVKQ